MGHRHFRERVNALCPTQTLCVGSEQRGRGGKRAADRWQAGLQAGKHKDGLKGEFAHLFTFSNASNARVLTVILT
jgi:hypothetical protein